MIGSSLRQVVAHDGSTVSNLWRCLSRKRRYAYNNNNNNNNKKLNKTARENNSNNQFIGMSLKIGHTSSNFK